MEYLVKVRVQPGSRRNTLEHTADGYKVHLTAPPVEGKANKALIAYLARCWNLRKSAISIKRGEKSRNKLLAIQADSFPPT